MVIDTVSFVVSMEREAPIALLPTSNDGAGGDLESGTESNDERRLDTEESTELSHTPWGIRCCRVRWLSGCPCFLLRVEVGLVERVGGDGDDVLVSLGIYGEIGKAAGELKEVVPREGVFLLVCTNLMSPNGTGSYFSPVKDNVPQDLLSNSLSIILFPTDSLLPQTLPGHPSPHPVGLLGSYLS